MSRGINKVILIGNLGTDPEVRHTQGGNAVCNLSVATSETWRDKTSGEMKKATEWHQVVLFGRTGEVAGEYLQKGSKVYIEGQLRTRKWQDASGQDRYATEIIGREMQMLSSSARGNGDRDRRGSESSRSRVSPPSTMPDDHLPIDDVPF